MGHTLNIMNRFNYFTKLQPDLAKSTFIGALISLLTLLTAIFLSLYFIFPQTETINKKLIISKHSTSNSLNVTIDITFHNAPCATLRLSKERNSMQETSLNNDKTMIHEIVFTRVNTNEDYVDKSINAEYDEEEEVKIVLTGLKDSEECRVKGSFVVEPIPGSFSISHQFASAVLSQVQKLNAEWYGRLNLAHTINSLNFGNSNTSINFISKHNKAMSCLYYLKLIPKDNLNRNKKEYQYSFNQDCYVLLRNNYRTR